MPVCRTPWRTSRSVPVGTKTRDAPSAASDLNVSEISTPQVSLIWFQLIHPRCTQYTFKIESKCSCVHTTPNIWSIYVSRLFRTLRHEYNNFQYAGGDYNNQNVWKHCFHCRYSPMPQIYAAVRCTVCMWVKHGLIIFAYCFSRRTFLRILSHVMGEHS